MKKILKDKTNTNGNVYFPFNTKTGFRIDKDEDFELGYGSADLEGLRF